MMDPYLPSRESSAQFLAFRRLVYSFSQQLSKEERQAIVYIRLYSSREKYRDATTLEVLSKLETDCIFTPTKPEGLIEIAKDVKRQDLVNEVKDFIKRRKGLKDEQKMSKGATQAGANATQSDEDLHLRSILEVTLSQATVLMQQVDLLQRAMVAGQVQRRRVEEVVQEASQTAERLAETLHKAQTELDPTYHQQTDSSPDSSPAASPQNQLPYCYVAKGTFPGVTATPLQAQDLPDVTRPPVPMPRRPAYTTTQLPMQETCLSARTLPGYLANTHISNEQLHTRASSPSDVFPRPRRWTKPREDKSQSAPCTPSLQKRYSAHQPVTKKPAVPPRRTSIQSSLLGSRLVQAQTAQTNSHTQQPADVEDYVTLTPEPADDYTGSTGDSGIGDIDQWRTRKGSEAHYYKSLHRSEVEDSYEELRRR